MAEAPVEIDLSARAHVGIVIMRPHRGEERGLLLLNAAETAARIRFLDGFRAASFLVDPGGAIVAEYLQWQSAAHVGAAFHQPEFAEHLPIVGTMADHPTVAFGAPAAVLTATGRASFAMDHPRYAMTVLRSDDGAHDRTLRSVVAWCRGSVGGEIAAAAVHDDPESRQIGVLLAGSFTEQPPPTLLDGSVAVVEHLGELELYRSYGPPANPEAALRYTMKART